MENNNNGSPDTYPLDDAAIATVAELRETMRAAQVAITAVLQYFARQHDLKGQLQLSENGRELIMKRQVNPTETVRQ